MSQIDRNRAAKVLDDLAAEERTWLEQQTSRYQELLAYLQEH